MRLVANIMVRGKLIQQQWVLSLALRGEFFPGEVCGQLGPEKMAKMAIPGVEVI